MQFKVERKEDDGLVSFEEMPCPSFGVVKKAEDSCLIGTVVYMSENKAIFIHDDSYYNHPFSGRAKSVRVRLLEPGDCIRVKE